jgi:hypothetical protein
MPSGGFPPSRTKWTRRVPHPVLIGHAVCLVTGNHSIRRVNASTGAVSTLVGARSTLGLALAGYADATSAADARLRRPEGVAFDPAGLRLVVADTGNHALRVIAVRDGVTGAVTTVAGDGLQGIGLGDASKARLSAPGAASFSPDGSPPPPALPPESGGSAPAPHGANNPRGACRSSLLVADTGNNRLLCAPRPLLALRVTAHPVATASMIQIELLYCQLTLNPRNAVRVSRRTTAPAAQVSRPPCAPCFQDGGPRSARGCLAGGRRRGQSRGRAGQRRGGAVRRTDGARALL